MSVCEYNFQKAGRKTVVKPILTSEYKTPALRPLNSRLNCELTETTFDIARPYWLKGLANVIEVLRISHENRKGIILAGGSGTRLYL